MIIPKYSIVVSKYATKGEQFAAFELQKYLYLSIGKCFPCFNDSVEKFSPEIIIGFGAREKETLINREELGEEGFVIYPYVDKDVLIAGNTARGTIYGVYSFLEKFCGLKRFTKEVEVVKEIKNFNLPTEVIIEKPAFEYRDAYFRLAFDEDFATKNKMNLSQANISVKRGGNVKFFTIGHTFANLLPPEKYFEEHPEYFALVNGERTPDQPCLTNPKVFNIVRENLINQIKENPTCKIFSVAQNDVDVCCQCENCKKVNDREQSLSGTNINFVNKIAESIRADYPEVLIHTFAYRFSRKAPKYLIPNDNVIVRLCNIECDWSQPFEELANNGNNPANEFLQNVKEWGNITKHLYVWDYAVNFHNYLLPFPNLYQMAKNIKLLAKSGVNGLMEQGNYTYCGGASLDELKVYLISKLLWNPNEDARLIIEDFCNNVYGKGGKYIVQYIDLITEAVKGHKLTLYDNADATYFTDDLVEKCVDLFNKAIEFAENETIKDRIRKEFLAIEYLRIVRIENDEFRCKEVDRFAQKLQKYGITEIMEKTALDDSLEFMKIKRFATERFHRYDYLRYNTI